MNEESPAAPRSKWFSFQHPRFVISLLLIAGGLVLYAPVKSFSFVSADDPQYIWLNMHVMAGLNAKSISWAFKSINVFYWQPLTWLSHMLDVTLYGLNAAGHHFTSILWHVLNGVLLFLGLERASGRLLRSAMVAALFVVHPLNLEPVIWIAERKTVLCTFFFLLALTVYGWYVAKVSWQRYALVLLCYIFALMAKPIVVTLPLLLLLLDYWPFERLKFPHFPLNHGELKQVFLLISEKIPFAALAALSSVVTYLGQKSESAVIPQSVFPYHLRIANALYSYCVYIGKIFWPRRLSVFYPMPQNLWNGWLVLLAALTLAGITCIVLFCRKDKHLPACWLWFLVTLVPMIGLVQVGGQSRADRHVYLPMMGLLTLAVWVIADGCKKLHVSTALCWAGSVVILITLCWDARIQMQYWRNSETLFTRSLEITPEGNDFAHMNMATALAEEGRFAEAMPHFDLVYQHFPNIPEFREWHANVLSRNGQFQKAIPEYVAALSLAQDQPLKARLHYELGMAFVETNNLQDAESEFRNSIRLDPAASIRTYIKLGYLLGKKGKLDEAIDQYDRSIELLPTAQAYLLLGEALHQKGENKEAEIAYRNALGLDPHSREIQQRLQQLEQSTEQH